MKMGCNFGGPFSKIIVALVVTAKTKKGEIPTYSMP